MPTSLILAAGVPVEAVADASVIRANPVTEWFDDNSSALISGVINIVIIVVVALVLRAVLSRVIDKLANRMVVSQQRTRSRFAGRLVEPSQNSRVERQQMRADTIASVLKSVASFVVFGVAIVTILSQVGINIGPILASAGVLGLAVAFGAQSLVQDFVSGIFMMSEDQYGVGDVVDVGDAVGTVEAVSLRVTKIRDLNGGLWYVRNGEIMRVCNMNQDWANVVVELPLDYSVDLEDAKRVIQASIDQFADDEQFAPQILERPDIAGVVAIGNGAVTVRVMVTTRPGSQWALGRALRAHLKAGLDLHGIKVAYPVLPVTGAGAAQQG
ncbi:small conductance mechanosensitive channel [Haloactinopolyspora alba]|uniref:Small conductance mechanosensitive channel n=1 Tax=Haloactinopolyspora alba TaxID=648780 RepID=A0A2P8E560_9ACTN|nr:mechanosensitive ion channel domain-containing protein [Haloactinopolyspora alba]PSL04567.1 small conductance mechanosensitive channel [Haloactinopolyspora alba]